ncbi:phosphonate metabolism protein/1,5-bisphosphokinase (PRPP-forming) PhnN [Pigmentiphaga aceris]|uniref:Ribose 1,5-bisphosphate phosphokinase PhnN n=1 Tax=Pigmentiphaga aceris TaxID=1940612 RepID=A0A5C0AZR1_9BURK|nr:phosphonate metabolism protein/1,5-bisphosphokinase (PRPP-forming) PhnN [Pigmentiphaga aceris]QEI06350.1 phosphonate metabolism protein/1,5-bisphosphokinase (PRPP-forming) PhnN [Pigmentiphaga aceris]
MNRLIYTVGPSGAGKDSLLGWLRSNLPSNAPVHLARRTVSRPSHVGGEPHESVDANEFEYLRARKAFVFDWTANDLQYGVREAELSPLQDGAWVLVNGSRAHLPQAARKFPGLTVLHITASADTLRQRLLSRGRETPEMVEARIARAAHLAWPMGAGAIEIRNDSTLDEAGEQLLDALECLEGWPRKAAVMC